MICDNIKNCGIYRDIHPLFVQAFDFLCNKAHTLEDGRYELDGDNLFVMLVSPDLIDKTTAKLEAHDRYIDIQYIIDGSESFGYKVREKCLEPKSSFDVENDIIFFSDKIDNIVTLRSGDFIVFYPQDGHAPLIGSGKSRKAIVKVKCI